VSRSALVFLDGAVARPVASKVAELDVDQTTSRRVVIAPCHCVEFDGCFLQVALFEELFAVAEMGEGTGGIWFRRFCLRNGTTDEQGARATTLACPEVHFRPAFILVPFADLSAAPSQSRLGVRFTVLEGIGALYAWPYNRRPRVHRTNMDTLYWLTFGFLFLVAMGTILGSFLP